VQTEQLFLTIWQKNYFQISLTICWCKQLSKCYYWYDTDTQKSSD